MTEREHLARRIASLLEPGPGAADLAPIYAGIEKINHRLDKLEAELRRSENEIRIVEEHPSVEKFSIAEAIADAVFKSASNEKACTFEPNDRPCDHCSMCSSRGF
jgi:hypothetical protein